jgi:hypothetical protein
VSLVRDAAAPGAVGRRASLAVVLALATATVTGCSESGGDAPVSGAGSGIDVPLRLADCADWNEASVAEKLGTVVRIETFAGGPTGSPAGHGSTIPREQAYDVLEGWCDNDFARSFKLYKLYTRASAFQGLAEAIEKQEAG